MLNKKSSSVYQKAFTLLEVLIVVAIVAILAGIVIVAINPSKQLGNARDSQRKSDIGSIFTAINQYAVDYGHYPIGISSTPTPICDPAQSCSGSIDLSALIPTYLIGMPKDPMSTTDTGYSVAVANSNIYVEAPMTEIGFKNQFGYSSTTPIVAFAGAIPAGYTPPAATQGTPSGGGGNGGSQQQTNYALQFDGSTQHVTISEVSLENVFSVSVWYKLNSLSHSSTIIGNSSGAGASGYDALMLRPDQGTIYLLTDNQQVGIPYTSWDTTTWHHLVLLYNAGHYSVYVDDSLIGDSSFGDSALSINEIGQYATGGGNGLAFDGSLDDLRLYSTELTTGDISALYNNGVGTESESGSLGTDLIAHWKFDEGTGITTADSSGNGNTGTLVNSPTWVTR